MNRSKGVSIQSVESLERSVENQEENSSLALEFFENMNEPNASGCSVDLCMRLYCGHAFLDAFKARRLSNAHFLDICR
jgi:hypothetical protein